MEPHFFFCWNCGTIHEVHWHDLKDEQWAKIMFYIKEQDPTSVQLAEEFNFTRRMAQVYLKQFKELSARLIKSSLYAGEGKQP